jgi:crotonobetainyl-CoA:carnitine CoA-transferase CaiB-like acyl-CoA transferase
MAGALEGIKIVDLTAVLLGPYATQMMADMGADVIKVEPPQGDLLRNSGLGRTKQMGPIYLAANRNKRSICLDLKKKEAIEIVKHLAKDADIFIHNNRPQAIDRLGLSYEDLKAVNPSIIYAYAMGYGRKGPYGERPAFDDLVQGASGAATLQSRVDDSAPQYIPSLIADKTTGLHLAIATLGALVHRQKTGEGQKIEVPMFETMTSFWMTEHLFGETYKPAIGTMGYDRIINRYRHPFETKDGHICVLPYTDKHWERYFEIVGRPELAADDRFTNAQQRARRYNELYQIMDEVMRAKTTAEWVALMEAADIPVTAVKSLEQLLHDTHLNAVGFYAEREHPTEGPIVTFRSPMEFEKTPTEFRRHAPKLGADGREVLTQAGYSAERIDALISCGAMLLPGAD